MLEQNSAFRAHPSIRHRRLELEWTVQVRSQSRAHQPIHHDPRLTGQQGQRQEQAHQPIRHRHYWKKRQEQEQAHYPIRHHRCSTTHREQARELRPNHRHSHWKRWEQRHHYR